MRGWICSYRRIWEHPFFKGHGMRVAIWHWLLHNAAWKDTSHQVNGVTIPIYRGEVCFTQKQIQEVTGASRRQIRDVLDWLTENGKATKIGAKDKAKGGAKLGAKPKTILRIEKYDELQSGRSDGAKGEASYGPSKEQGKNETTPEANASGAADAASGTVQVSVPKALWDVGPRYLISKGVDPKQARSVIGRWLKDHDGTAILSAIKASEESGTGDPIPYITEVPKPAGAVDLDAIFARIEEE